jgi:putative endonuclease
MSEQKKCFVYVLQSELNGLYYIGCTNNLEDRMKRHNEGRSKFTKPYRPLRLVFSKEFPSKSEAMKFEKELKAYKSREILDRMIQQQ